MPYVVQRNASVSLLHILRNLAGTGVVTGGAAALTYRIVSPTGVLTTSGISWTEPRSDGYYYGAKTYNELGSWHVEVNNVAVTGSDQGKYDYYIQCVVGAAGIPPTGLFLTTSGNFLEMVENAETDAGYITNLIARATQRIERLVGRTLVQATYTERYDGRGVRGLNLRKGPVQSVTYVAEVTYASNGTPTTRSLAAGDYFVRGTAADGWNLPGWLEMSSGVWTPGQQNYEVEYSAGYSAVPYDLEAACLELCVWQWNQRKSLGLAGRDIGDGAQSFRGADELLDKLRGELEPYIDTRAA